MTDLLQQPEDSAQKGVLSDDYRPVKCPALSQRDLTDGCVLHHPERETVYTLNSTASFVLTFCTGDYSLAQIAQETSRAFALDPEEAFRDIVSVVSALKSENLLAPRDCGG